MPKMKLTMGDVIRNFFILGLMLVAPVISMFKAISFLGNDNDGSGEFVMFLALTFATAVPVLYLFVREIRIFKKLRDENRKKIIQ
ncbi:MAG: hypothetical protein WC043_01500 [Pseudobdellovibrionaceae bacterium]